MPNQSLFPPDTQLTEVLNRNDFTISAEIIPPRNGAEQLRVLEQVSSLVGAGAQFLAVTKGAGGSLRGGSLPIAQAIKERLKVPCIAHFTCRDLVAAEVENQLIDHHYFGIRNILALRGDPPDGQPQWKAREGGHDFAYQLIQQIRGLNEGRFIPRHGIEPEGPQLATDFCIGAAVYPDAANQEAQLEYFSLKVKSGAHFAITDMLFDPDAYGRFLDRCGRHGIHIPILPGTRVLKTREQAYKMMARFKTRVPESYLNALHEKDGPGALEQGIELLVKNAERLKRLGAPGIHLFVIGDTHGSSRALSRLAEFEKRDTSQ